MTEQENDIIDKTQWLPEGLPIITQERALKGDIVTDDPCDGCDMSGKDSNGDICKKCKGKGRTGSKNAVYVDFSSIRFAHTQMRNIMNYFWNAGTITDQHFHDGQTFQIWRDIHQVALGFKKPLSSGDPEQPGVRLRAYGYVLLTQRLSRNNQKAIELAIETFANHFNRELAHRQRHLYHTAFEALSQAMLPIKDQITYLESLSDEDRDCLSEERLKKLIAGIAKYV